MIFIKSLIITFSLYSKVPMPIFIWEKEDKSYVSSSLPFVGALIGCFVYLVHRLCIFLELNNIVSIAALIALPLILSGGIHLDGFLDVSDALSSYGTKEKKLEILKDPHIGAFAIINLLKLLMILVIGLGMLENEKAYIALAFSYIYSRIFASVAILTIKNARGNGMLYEISAGGKVKIINMLMLLFEFILTSLFAIYIADAYAVILILVSILCYCYYVMKMNKEFGGITGDTEGWFIINSEAMMALAIGILGVIL